MMGVAGFPFSAIVGQEEMKIALMLAVINPEIKGVLLFGNRGTGKSTIVRSLANLLPSIRVDKDCEFNCDLSYGEYLCDSCKQKVREGSIELISRPVPMVTLPLGATEDKVCGSLDIEYALRYKKRRFEPGILAKANRGFLYIDEVNLLEDYLVDLLLDVSASGVNIVEREGFSVRHQARFVLVGSGNPEEGDLRPQLLDRFGLFVEVRSIDDAKKRVEIIKRRLAFQENPEEFCKVYEKYDSALKERILLARERLYDIYISDKLIENISLLSVELGVDGHRGEITTYNSAIALTGLLGKEEVTMDEVFFVAELSFPHRLRKHPLQDIPTKRKILSVFEKLFPDEYAHFVNEGREKILRDIFGELYL